MKTPYLKMLFAMLLAFVIQSASAVTGSSSKTIVPGEWNSNFNEAMAFAAENDMPLIAVWSKKGCHFCNIFDTNLEKEEFKAWAAETKMVMIYLKATRDSDFLTQRDWIRGSNTGFPFVRVYWEKKGSATKSDRFTGRASSYGGGVDNLIARIKKTIGDWKYESTPAYSGGSFATTGTDGNRLEAEDGTGSVSLELVRDAAIAEVATNNTLKVVGPDGKAAGEVTVNWKPGQTNQTVAVDISSVNFTEDGQQALLIAVDAEGVEQATNTVTYVADSGKNPANPLWIGERKASGGSSSPKANVRLLGAAPATALEWGEWTMDLDVATNKVAATKGDAYTLVLIEGSLWCHDCANTERNFLNVKDGSGKYRFVEWAKSNNVALVALDIPNFSTNSVECASPTILSRKAYTTTLAFEGDVRGTKFYDVSKGGAPESLTKPMERSGLGYLTRKGISDEDAATVLERNWKLVTTNTDKGGFHRPEDTNKFRTGVPIFVLLRKNGTVAARMTRFAASSPMKDLNWDNAIKRLDEMLKVAATSGGHVDASEIANNDASTTALSFKANGGSGKGEISHADFQDVFKLEGVGGNALQKVVVTGAVDAVVSVQFMKLNAEGKSEAVGTAASGKLSESISLEETFAESGDFYVKVSGGDIAKGSFAVENPANDNFAAFSISGDVVLVPQEGKATGTAPEDSDRLVIRLEKDQMYRIEGVNPANDVVAKVLEPKDAGDSYCKFYTALVSGDVEIVAAYGKGGSVSYQKWMPGKVGFLSEAKTVTESAGDVTVALARTDGSSGEVKVRVSLDEEATTLYDSDETARFAFDPVEIVWDDGKNGETNVVIKVFDDTRFDGPGNVALKLELLKDENGDTVLTATNYVLTVTEDDKQSAGVVAFTAVDPFFSKKGTVYAKESAGTKIYAERLEASDGYVTAQIKSSGNGTFEIDGQKTNVLVWANHQYAPKEIKVTGVPAGKSATLTLEKPTDGLTLLAASNKVTVVSVADDAPEFETASASATIYRYIASSNAYPVVLAEGVKGAKLTFTKLLGTLPAGLKATYDEAANAMVIAGATTANAGVYTVVYQVTQQADSKKTPGLTTEITFTVVDPTVESVIEPYNAAIAAQNGKARTIKDIPIVSSNRLTGVLTVTIPAKGNVSAKYTCSAGKVAFSAKGWSTFDPESKELTATLASKTTGYSMVLVACDDGSVAVDIVDPNNGDLEGESTGNVWSKDNSAEEAKGYYTVALISDGVTEAREGVAPRGDGYLTLKMEKAKDWNAGKMTWAGMLPNGTSVSGSAILSRTDCDSLSLPVFKRTATDELAVLLDVCSSVTEADGIGAVWLHADKTSEDLSYEVEFNTYGGHYSATNSLAEAFAIGYPNVKNQTIAFDIAGLLGRVGGGVPASVDEVAVTIADSKISIAKDAANPQGVTLSFDSKKGIVKGKFNLPYTTASGSAKTLKVDYQGVVLIGWGADCGCGLDDSPDLPTLAFVNGAFYVSDSETVSVKGKDKNVSIKRGGSVRIGVVSEE